MTLVRLPLRGGEALAESRLIEGGEVYFCAKDHCPHYQGQLGLIAEAATMYCALVHYAPDRTCQPYYLEAAEHLDQNRRQTWQERLEEAEAFEKSLGGPSNPLSSPHPSTPPEAPQFEAAFRGRCDVARTFMSGRNRRHHNTPGETNLSSHRDDPLSSPGFQPGVRSNLLPFPRTQPSNTEPTPTPPPSIPGSEGAPSPAPRGREGEGARLTWTAR